MMVVAVLSVSTVTILAIISMNAIHDTAVNESTEALIALATEDLLNLTVTHARAINDQFESYQSQLQYLTKLMKRYYEDVDLHGSLLSNDTVIQDRVFYGAINGTINGTIHRLTDGDPMEIWSNDTGASILGFSNMTIHGAVNLAVYEQYSGALQSPDSKVMIEVRLENETVLPIKINDFYHANGDSFGTNLIDEWNATNPDGLIGPLSGLHQELIALGAVSVHRFFFVYDPSEDHVGRLEPVECVEAIGEQPSCDRVEGMIEGSINGTFQGILRARIEQLQVNGTIDERQGVFSQLFSLYWNQNQPTFSWVYLCLPRQNLFYQYPWNPNYNFNSLYYTGVNYDCRTRQWFEDVFTLENESIRQGNPKGSKLFWTSLIVDANLGKVGINLARVLYDGDGNLIGPMVFGMLIQPIVEEIQAISVKTSGFAFMLDSEGNVIISPQIGELEERKGRTHQISLSTRGILNASELTRLDDQLQPLVEKMTRQETGIWKQVLNEDDNASLPEVVYFAHAPIPATGWSMAIVVPESEIIEPALTTGKSIRNAIFLTEMAFILMLLAGLLAALVILAFIIK